VFVSCAVSTSVGMAPELMTWAAGTIGAKATIPSLRGDITDVPVAVHHRGGPAILSECRDLRAARFTDLPDPGEHPVFRIG
jgi:hypothetical protein